jgi:hypothetical protein
MFFISLNSASITLHQQIAYNTSMGLTETENILCEMKHPLSKHIQFCYQMPSPDDIFKYLECLFHAAELGVECAIISLVRNL